MTKKLLWLSWKDIRHPQAGGAEVVTDQLLTRLVNDGWEVILFTSRYKDSSQTQNMNGYNIIRSGNRLTVYWQAFQYYKKYLSDWPDIVIDEMNTIPFLANKYVTQPHALFAHMLCREIWFAQTIFPISLIGYCLEPLYLRLLHHQPVITVSQSTKDDLLKYGFKSDNIKIISEGIEMSPLDALPVKRWKVDQSHLSRSISTHPPTILALGSIRPMKQTQHVVRAFELAKQSIPNLKLVVAGESDSGYGQYVLQQITQSEFSQDISYRGRVSFEEKMQLMRDCDVICVASRKEGWGLIVTEANSQGTPAIAYNVDGLRDSVQNTITGLLTVQNNPVGMAEKIIYMFNHPSEYQDMRQKAWQWSKTITFDKSYKQFLDIITPLAGNSK